MAKELSAADLFARIQSEKNDAFPGMPIGYASLVDRKMKEKEYGKSIREAMIRRAEMLDKNAKRDINYSNKSNS